MQHGGISLQAVTKQYASLIAVKNLTLSVLPGELFCFLGPNGAGKSTTIKLITGVLHPTAGRVLVGGHDPARDEVAAKRLIGYIPEQPYLYDKLTGSELLQFVARLHRRDSVAAASRADRLLEQFGLLDARHRLVETYSHGMRQRLVYCMALLPDPPILVVDEPLVGLDPAGARMVKDTLRALCKDFGKTVFMSTHLLSVAEEIADSVGIIDRGVLLVHHDIETLRARYDLGRQTLESLFLALTAAARPA